MTNWWERYRRRRRTLFDLEDNIREGLPLYEDVEIVPLPEEARCPVCKGRVEHRFDCPGYQRGEYEDGRPRIMVCYPPCGNADLFECLGEGERRGCGWWYRDPDRRHDPGMGGRPDWLERYGYHGERSTDEWEDVTDQVTITSLGDDTFKVEGLDAAE